MKNQFLSRDVYVKLEAKTLTGQKKFLLFTDKNLIGRLKAQARALEDPREEIPQILTDEIENVQFSWSYYDPSLQSDA